MILDGKKVVETYKTELLTKIEEYKSQGMRPKMAIIQPQQDAASMAYLRGRMKLAKTLGVEIVPIGFDANVSQAQVIQTVEMVNKDKSIWGVIIDRPLPKNMDENEVLNYLDPHKDIDGCTYTSFGKVALSKNSIAPSTAQAVIDLLKYYEIPLVGKKVAVIGRSKTVGLPVANMLIKEDATVTVCHTKTSNLKEVCLNADILVVAVGKKDFITEENVSKKSVIIDVGINVDDDGKICGDVCKKACEKVSSYSPVPGGVGALTNLEIFKNLLKTKERI